MLQGGLVHRYSFSDADNGSIHDSVGDTSASLKGGAGVDNLGALQLDGVNDWLELPSDLLSNLQNLSVEAWLEWDGPASSSWQTLFVFSRDNLGYFSFSPRAGTSPRKSRFAVAQNGPEKKVNGNAEFPTGEVVHVVTVFDSVSQELRLYVDGILQGSSVCSFALASIDIKNLWIGRPLYTQFPYFKGRLLELRIHDDALTDSKVEISKNFGPDVLPGPLVSSFTASANSVRSGSKVRLSWEVSDGSVVELEPVGADNLQSSGTLEVTVSKTTEYVLRATNEDGVRTSRVVVQVDDRPIIHNFDVSPRVVTAGEPVTLSWDVAHATEISINQGVPPISDSSGTIEVRPDSSCTYTLSATNSSGTQTARVFVSVPGRLDLVINEIHYDSYPKTEKTEFVELLNNRQTELDLSGWRFSDGIDFTFPTGTTIAAGAYLVLAEDSAAFEQKYGKTPAGEYIGKLSNGGERITIRDASGEQADEVDFGVGFPWPTSSNGEGPSMQLLNPGLDNDLGGSWRSADPSPGVRNSVFSEKPPPQVRQVRHKPEQPLSGEPVTVKARVTGNVPVSEVILSYQLVEPGDYIAIDDARYVSRWISLPMRDDGIAGDVDAGDSTYTIVLPGELSVHRQLVRYRIMAKDDGGATVVTPFQDDPQPNFAFFAYDGIPEWKASARPGAASVTYSSETLSTLPVYHLITTRKSHEESQHIPSSSAGSYRGSDYQWKGTLVYDGKVYDHIRYRARGGVWRYAMGKNMWKFDFNRGHGFQARDDYGKKYKTKWDKLNFSSIIQQGNFGHRGENGMFESVGFRLFNLAGVEGPHTNFVHFRIIESAFENAGNQYSTDFQGPYLAIEQLNGDFLDAHGLPDGNLYKMERNTGPNRIGGESNNQGRDTVTDYSDLHEFKLTYESGNQSEAWWRANFNLPSYYSYRSICEGIHHGDIGYGKNYFYYRNPLTGLWQTVPWDLDLTWANNMYGNGNEPFKSRVANSSTFSHEYQNRLREIRDLLYNPEQAGALIDEIAAFIHNPDGPDFADANRDMWDYNPILASSYVNSGKAGHGRFYGAANTKDFSGMLQVMKDYVVSRGNWIDSTLLTDNQMPNRPTAVYTGPAGYPADRLDFQTSSFADPQGSDTFLGLRWRIAEVKHPGLPEYESLKQGKYEITALWEHELDAFSEAITIPANIVEPGRRYRIRVRHGDNTGRWSHWSSPIEIVPGPPLRLTDLKKFLSITELHADPVPATSVEEAAGFKTSDFEFLEIYNLSENTLNLSGLRFDDGIRYTFADGTTLAPQIRMLLVANRAAFDLRYGANHPIIGEYTGKLNNGGEKLRLLVPSDVAVHEFEFPRSLVPGRSVVLINPQPDTDYSQQGIWGTGTESGGTPGQIDQSSSDGDSDGLPDDWELQFFGNTESSHDEDFDNDGLVNLLEYALGCDPIDSNSANLPEFNINSDGFGMLSYTRPAETLGLTYFIESSVDLNTWQVANDNFDISIITEGAVSSVLAQLKQPIQQMPFYRVTVSTP